MPLLLLGQQIAGDPGHRHALATAELPNVLVGLVLAHPPGLHQQELGLVDGLPVLTAPAQVLILLVQQVVLLAARNTQLDGRQNLLRLKRLGEVPRRPARLYELDVLPVAERRQNDDTFGGPVRQNLSGHAHAVQQRHLDVQQRHVRGRRPAALHRLHPVTGLAHHPISGEPLKKSAQGTANALIVISQENGGLAHPGHTHTPVLPFYKKEHLEAHKNASRCSPRI